MAMLRSVSNECSRGSSLRFIAGEPPAVVPELVWPRPLRRGSGQCGKHCSSAPQWARLRSCSPPQILKRKGLRFPVVAPSVSSGKTFQRKRPCAHAQGYESHRLPWGIFDGLHWKCLDAEPSRLGLRSSRVCEESFHSGKESTAATRGCCPFCLCADSIIEQPERRVVSGVTQILAHPRRRL